MQRLRLVGKPSRDCTQRMRIRRDPHRVVCPGKYLTKGAVQQERGSLERVYWHRMYYNSLLPDK